MQVLWGSPLRIGEAREILAALRELSSCYEETSNLLMEVTDEAASLKHLIGNSSDPNTSRLMKIGVTLLAAPEPFTTPIGASLLIIGLARRRMKPLTLMDVKQELQRLERKMRVGF